MEVNQHREEYIALDDQIAMAEKLRQKKDGEENNEAQGGLGNELEPDRGGGKPKEKDQDKEDR